LTPCLEDCSGGGAIVKRGEAGIVVVAMGSTLKFVVFEKGFGFGGQVADVFEVLNPERVVL